MVRYPFCWICLWPLAAPSASPTGAGRGSVVVAHELLKPPQMRLPVELEDVLRSAISAWNGGDPGLAAGELGPGAATGDGAELRLTGTIRGYLSIGIFDPAE